MEESKRANEVFQSRRLHSILNFHKLKLNTEPYQCKDIWRLRFIFHTYFLFSPNLENKTRE